MTENTRPIGDEELDNCIQVLQVLFLDLVLVKLTGRQKTAINKAYKSLRRSRQKAGLWITFEENPHRRDKIPRSYSTSEQGVVLAPSVSDLTGVGKLGDTEWGELMSVLSRLAKDKKQWEIILIERHLKFPDLLKSIAREARLARRQDPVVEVRWHALAESKVEGCMRSLQLLGDDPDQALQSDHLWLALLAVRRKARRLRRRSFSTNSVSDGEMNRAQFWLEKISTDPDCVQDPHEIKGLITKLLRWQRKSEARKRGRSSVEERRNQIRRTPVRPRPVSTHSQTVETPEPKRSWFQKIFGK